MSLPSSVKIVEVAPRDGLQNESQIISVSDKIELIHLLADSGLQYIEAGSFVSAKSIPQMARSAEVISGIHQKPGVSYAVLTPNMKGFEAAMDAGATEVAVFASASESFSQRNINCSITESLHRFEPLVTKARKLNIPVRAYVSCIAECPYEGHIPANKTADVSSTLFDMGCYEISLGDTIGKGTPLIISEVISAVNEKLPLSAIAVHFHNTYGQALANIYAALTNGVGIVDSSVAGLGGCPYAKGATGNIATEDVVYLLDGLKIEHGLNLGKLIQAGDFICDKLQRESQSMVAKSLSTGELKD